MPATWDGYGVDANGDGVADPYNPEDAIFAAASYLSAAGMPADTYGAIFAYNHADWYVSEVLANAGCYAAEVGGPALARRPRPADRRSSTAAPPRPGSRRSRTSYLRAFEDAAARYELGKRGVWALAAVARLESNFGRGMDKKQLRDRRAARARPQRVGALRGRRRRRRPHPPRRPGRLGGDAGAADLVARQPQRRHLHPQPGRVVRAGGAAAGRRDRRRAARSATSTGAWRRWRTGFETAGPNAVLSRRPRQRPAQSAPPAVKAAIAAANSISTTPYVWGGGHGSWYSYGYDCSGAVSFALYGAGLLDTPLTSGSLESYGEPGPGKWITIYANATHTYAVIAGLRWDTVGDAPGTGPRWHVEPPYPEGFVVRHPAGY